LKPPIFIVGCPRSGTSYLYHLLLSAGGFAEFRTQMNVFDVLEPIFGDLRMPKSKKRLLDQWLSSKAFDVSGLTTAQVEQAVAQSSNGSDFLRFIMEAVACNQRVDRWVDSTPTNIPHIPRIKKDFPDALFVHIIRDPRDVALSLDKRGWTRPLPWDGEQRLVAAGLYWEWIVRKGRKLGANLGKDYVEVRYEDLVNDPADALQKLEGFLSHPLNYAHIRETSVGSVKNPLTSFKEDLKQGRFTPVGRWKDKFPARQLFLMESAIGEYMQELGYPLSATAAETKRPKMTVKRLEYRLFYDFKQWAKIHTPLSRWMVSYSGILIDK